MDTVKKMFMIFNGDYYSPLYIYCGFHLEDGIHHGKTKSLFTFQKVVCAGGIDQSIAFPSGSPFSDYRSDSGFEYGFNPVWPILKVIWIYTSRWTFNFYSIFLPLDIIVVTDLLTGHHAIIHSGLYFHID